MSTLSVSRTLTSTSTSTMEWTLECNAATVYQNWIISPIRHWSATTNRSISFITAFAYSQQSIPRSLPSTLPSLRLFNAKLTFTQHSRSISPPFLISSSLIATQLTNWSKITLSSIVPIDSLSHDSIDSNYHFTYFSRSLLLQLLVLLLLKHHIISFAAMYSMHVLPVYDAIIMQVTETSQDLPSVVPHCAHFEGSEMLQ